MDVDRFRAAPLYQRFHGTAGIPLPAVLFGHKDAVHLIAVRVPGEPGSRDKTSIYKYAKYPFAYQVSFLAPVLFPQFLCQIKLIALQFTGLGLHPILSTLYDSVRDFFGHSTI